MLVIPCVPSKTRWLGVIWSIKREKYWKEKEGKLFANEDLLPELISISNADTRVTITSNYYWGWKWKLLAKHMVCWHVFRLSFGHAVLWLWEECEYCRCHFKDCGIISTADEILFIRKSLRHFYNKKTT